MDLDVLLYSPSLCPRNTLLIDQVRDAKSTCHTCRKPWESREIRVRQRSRAYHLHCFTPDYQMRIYNGNVRMLELSSSNERLVATWLQQYNERFRIASLSSLQRFHTADDSHTVRYRHLLEIFKYFTAKECATVLTCVSKEWRLHSLDCEVWSALLAKQYPDAVEATIHPRDAYIRCFHLSCYGCKQQLPPDSEVLTKHPITGQPLCEKCFPRQLFNKVLVESYCGYLGVTRGYLAASGVRMFKLNYAEFLMPYEVKPKLVEYRKARLLRKCSELHSTSDVLSLQKIDPATVYYPKDINNAISKAVTPLVKRLIHYIFFEEDVTNLAIYPLKRRAKTPAAELSKRAKLS